MLITRLSSMYRTEPQDLRTRNWYVNAVAEVKTCLSAHDLFCLLREVESEMGRVRKIRYGPRSIDLDLLLYGQAILNTEELIVPHPRLHQRRFVLVPLSELSPELEHPLLKKRMQDLLNELDERGQKVIRMGPTG